MPSAWRSRRATSSSPRPQPVLEHADPVADQEHPDEDQGQGDEAEQQGPGHRPVDGGREVGVQHGGALMERLPPQHREVHDGHVHRGEQGDEGAALGPDLGLGRDPSEGQVAEEEDQQHGGAGQAGVPGPVDAPGRLAPDRPRDQGAHVEDHPHLDGGGGQPVPEQRTGAGPQIEQAGHGGQPEGRVERHPGHPGVDVDQAHQIALHLVGRRHPQPQPHGEGDAHRGGDADDPAR